MAEQREVEVKILAINREEMEQKLIALGAKKIFDDILEIHSFKPDNPSLGLIRVRKEGDETFLAIKSKEEKGFASSKIEYSVKVDDYDATVKIFELLDFKKKWYYKKHRISYQLGETRFEFDKLLDEYVFVPEYMEIECSSEAAVKEALAILEIPESEARSWTGGDVIRHYKK